MYSESEKARRTVGSPGAVCSAATSVISTGWQMTGNVFVSLDPLWFASPSRKTSTTCVPASRPSGKETVRASRSNTSSAQGSPLMATVTAPVEPKRRKRKSIVSPLR